MDRVYNRIEDAGISLMVAAGNDWTSTEIIPMARSLWFPTRITPWWARPLL